MCHDIIHIFPKSSSNEVLDQRISENFSQTLFCQLLDAVRVLHYSFINLQVIKFIVDMWRSVYFLSFGQNLMLLKLMLLCSLQTI